MQTKSLRLRGADGVEYVFRSVDKDHAVVPEQFKGTSMEGLARDGISASHPGAALVTAPLLDAVGILHTRPQLAVMPDDPALGEFRKDFAGRIGIIEEYPSEPEHGRGFGGAIDIIDSDTLRALLNASPEAEVDTRMFLTARLMDMPFFRRWRALETTYTLVILMAAPQSSIAVRFTSFISTHTSKKVAGNIGATDTVIPA